MKYWVLIYILLASLQGCASLNDRNWDLQPSGDEITRCPHGDAQDICDGAQ